MSDSVASGKPKRDLAEAAYDPKKGWSTAAQPETAGDRPFTVEEYIEIARAAAPDFIDQIRTFLQHSKFSYIEIPHQDFAEQYEQGRQGFREWLEEYCSKHNLNPHAQFCVIGPCIKTEQSSNRKTAYKSSPDRNRDYLRSMIVALKQTHRLRNSASLDNLESCTQALENDEGTIARKNYYHTPKNETGYRGYKTLRVATAPEGSTLEGVRILAELKIEHESQMDIDKLTRHFMDFDRIMEQKLFEGILRNVFGARSCLRAWDTADSKRDIVNGWSRLLYNRVFQDTGITDKFLNPAKKDEFAAEEWQNIVGHINSTGKRLLNGQFPSLIETIKGSGVLTSDYVPKCVRSKIDRYLG